MPNIAPKQKPQAVTELELVALETTRDMLSLLRKQVKEAEGRLSGQEQDLILRLEAGAKVVGSKTCLVKEVMQACRPSYQSILVAHMAKHHGKSEDTVLAEARAATDVPTKKVLVIGDAQ